MKNYRIKIGESYDLYTMDLEADSVSYGDPGTDDPFVRFYKIENNIDRIVFMVNAKNVIWVELIEDENKDT